MLIAVLIPAAARAEPITVASTEGGFRINGIVADSSINLGTIRMPSVGAVGDVLISGYRTNNDVVVTFLLEGLGRFDTLRLEVFNPSGSNNTGDPSDQASGLPTGYSSSNNRDALSFGQDSGLERSATFAGGKATVTADEFTDRGDILIFSGLAGAERARVTFAIRDGLKFFSGHAERGFLLRISAADPVSMPEPASMLLLGGGLAGLAAARRRRMLAAR
ncbi:MAG TPA: VPLPA-CTERM sorting domain-containing protein [Vicinamibacterales bacterium]|jgi:hypothetical protein